MKILLFAVISLVLLSGVFLLIRVIKTKKLKVALVLLNALLLTGSIIALGFSINQSVIEAREVTSWSPELNGYYENVRMENGDVYSGDISMGK